MRILGTQNIILALQDILEIRLTMLACLQRSPRIGIALKHYPIMRAIKIFDLHFLIKVLFKEAPIKPLSSVQDNIIKRIFHGIFPYLKVSSEATFDCSMIALIITHAY